VTVLSLGAAHTLTMVRPKIEENLAFIVSGQVVLAKWVPA
jgi:hypothetical protein